MNISRARLRMSGLGLGLENEEEAVEGVESEVSEAVEETVEQETMEVEEVAEGAEEQEEAVEELEEAAATLESIALRLEASLESGGMSKDAAQYLDIAVASTLRRVGVTQSVLPSLESFDGATGRLQSTKVSLEAIKDWLEKIWTAIKNAVLKAITWVKDLFAKLFGGAKKLSERAKKLKEELAKRKETTEKKEITFRSVSKLHLKGKADASDFMTAMSNMDEVIKIVYTKLPSLSEKLTKAYADKMVELAKAGSADAANAVHANAVTAVSTVIREVNNAVKGADSKPLPGGVKIVMQRPSETADKPESLDITLAPSQKFEQMSESATLPPLASKDIGTMLDLVISIADEIEKKKNTINDMAEKRKKAVDDYNKAVDEAKKKDFLQQKIVSWQVRGIQKDFSGFLGKISAHAFGACRAALVLCEKSIAAYDVK